MCHPYRNELFFICHPIFFCNNSTSRAGVFFFSLAHFFFPSKEKSRGFGKERRRKKNHSFCFSFESRVKKRKRDNRCFFLSLFLSLSRFAHCFCLDNNELGIRARVHTAERACARAPRTHEKKERLFLLLRSRRHRCRRHRPTLNEPRRPMPPLPRSPR